MVAQGRPTEADIDWLHLLVADGQLIADLAFADIVEETLKRKGTITGEHGVGLAKKPFLRKQLGDASHDLLKLVKRSLDPENLLNPGKIFDQA